MKIWLYYLHILLLCNYGAINAIKTNDVVITKILQHQKRLGDNVVILAAEQPLCNLISRAPQATDKECYVEFFMPKTSISNDVRGMIEKIHMTSRLGYSIQFQEAKKPLPGIKIIIRYDPEQVSFSQDFFDAISTQKGIVFAFHNKKMLDQLNHNTEKILHYVWNKPIEHKPCVVLDCGHGGSDDGKVGFFNIKEKDVTLTIGQKVASLLQKEGYHVLLSRERDIFVALDDRTLFANTKKADVFVSIHANSAPKDTVSGIETYWTGHATLKKGLSWLSNPQQATMSTLVHYHDDLNKKLAQSLHEEVIGYVQKTEPINDRKVKESVVQVLLGTEMPSALIEVGFLSNKEEAQRLNNAEYQALLAQGIGKGIIAFCNAALH